MLHSAATTFTAKGGMTQGEVTPTQKVGVFQG
jgi:hypothetical protein